MKPEAPEVEVLEQDVNAPKACKECGLQNSESCNTCTTLEKHGYSFETGV